MNAKELEEVIARSLTCHRIGEDGKTMAVPEDLLAKLRDSARILRILLTTHFP